MWLEQFTVDDFLLFRKKGCSILRSSVFFLTAILMSLFIEITTTDQIVFKKIKLYYGFGRCRKYPTFVRKSCYYIDNVVANANLCIDKIQRQIFINIKVPDLNQYATEILTTDMWTWYRFRAFTFWNNSEKLLTCWQILTKKH